MLFFLTGRLKSAGPIGIGPDKPVPERAGNRVERADRARRFGLSAMAVWLEQDTLPYLSRVSESVLSKTITAVEKR